ncbi:MAG: hypothetical protein AAGI03_02765 [Pseudomonadota bacterium]
MTASETSTSPPAECLAADMAAIAKLTTGFDGYYSPRNTPLDALRVLHLLLSTDSPLAASDQERATLCRIAAQGEAEIARILALVEEIHDIASKSNGG